MTTQRRADRTRKTASESPGDETAREALERARGHAQSAVSEGLSALRALVDAASLAASGFPADANPALRMVTKSIDVLAEQLRSDNPMVSPAVVAAVLDALDAEIARWELRSEDDAEARPVLRAFLGVREILWEVGLRRSGAEAGKQGDARAQGRSRARAQSPPDDSKSRTRAGRPRVQRLEVQG